MASIDKYLEDPEFANWVKSGLALNITNEVLRPFVVKEITKLHQSIVKTLPRGVSCTGCSVDTACPKGICDEIQREIENKHWYPNPSFTNTCTGRWSADPWEIAKCYMPPLQGYKRSAASDADFSACINVIINCKHFQAFGTSDPRGKETDLSKSRDFRNLVMHGSSQKVSEQYMKENLDILINILNMIKTPETEADTKEAREQIEMTKQLKIKFEDAIEVTKNAIEANADNLDKDEDQVQRERLLVNFEAGCRKALCRLTEEHISIQERNLSVAAFLSKIGIFAERKDLCSRHQNMLFPKTGTHAAIREWDLFVYCFILEELDLYEPIGNAVSLFVREVKKIRNRIVIDASGVTQDDLSELCDYLIDTDLNTDITEIFNKDSPDVDVICSFNILGSWWREEEDYGKKPISKKQLNIKKQIMEDVDKRLSENKDTIKREILEMLGYRGEHVTLQGDNAAVLDTACEVRVSGCDEETANATQEHITFPDNNDIERNEAIDHFRQQRNLLKVTPEKGSIILNVKCSSITNVLDFWDSCIDGRAVEALSKVRDYYRRYFKCDTLKFDVILTKKVVSRCVNEIVKGLPSHFERLIVEVTDEVRGILADKNTVTLGHTHLQMAEGEVSQDKRCSPIGKELEPEDKDIEGEIEFHLEQYWAIIIRDVAYYDLLIHYPLFSREQRRELNQIGKRVKNEDATTRGLQMIKEMDGHLDKYLTLKLSLRDAGYEKIAGILAGDLIPGITKTQRENIDKNFKMITHNVDPMEILPILLKHKVIDDTDHQLVENTRRNEGPIKGMVELLMVLANRQRHWYWRFVEAVLDTNSDIAEKIDPELCKKIKEIKESESTESYVSLMDEYSSCIPICKQTDNQDDKSRRQERAGENVRTDIGEHILEDYHDASIGVNNLSPPSKISQSVTDPLDFKDILDDNENVEHRSVSQSKNQSVTMRGDYVAQSTDGNQTESLDFNSLLSCTVVDQSKSLNNHAQVQTRSLNQPSSNTETIYSRNPGDGSPADDRSYSTRQDLSDETFLKDPCGSSQELSFNGILEVDRNNHLDISSIESNARVPEPTARKNSSLPGPRRSLEAYSTTLSDNSHSPDRKVLPDKNMDMLKGNEAMNIMTQEPDPDSIRTEEEDIEDTDITLRGYQEELAGPAIQGKNVIIVAPTGSGKTRVALRIIQEHIRKQQGRGIAKVVFLVNQVALANQQSEECLKQLRCYKSKVISGETQRGRREYLKDFVDKRDILIVTAQVLLDSLVRKEIEGIHAFSLLVFDECHHTHANHTFNQIMGMYMSLKFSKNPPALPQIVGLTASVGVGKSRNEEKAMEHIKKLMANLDAEMICTVQNNMQELREHVAIPDEETYTVSKRENDVFGETVTRLMNTIETMMSQSSVVKEMEEAKLFEKVMKSPAAKGSAQYEQWVSKLWKETAKLRSPDARRFLNPCRTHLVHYNNALLIHNDARVQDALNYLEREMTTWRDQARFMDENEKKLDRAFKKLYGYLSDKHSDNPKLKKLAEIIIKAYQRDPENSRGIVFVRTRELAKAIISWMRETNGLRELHPIQFLGQTPNADKGGMTKAEQDDVLKYFKDGKHKLIVATSVAEEGLDISKCNLVIRYDYVTNEIAMVQSRGRGRAKDSKYFVVAEEGSGMAEKEELNMIREIMMRKAIIKLQREIEEQPQKFKKDIHDLQDEAHLDHQLKSIGSRQRRLQAVGEFELQCIKCSQFICMSQDLKKVQGAHHVIVDETLSQRVAFVKSETEECAVDVNQPIGKLTCRNCGENLGVIAIYRKLEFPVPTINKFLIVDRNGRQTTKKRWKDVPWFIADLRNNDFRKILNARSQSGALDE